jgi:hypothetical protein
MTRPLAVLALAALTLTGCSHYYPPAPNSRVLHAAAVGGAAGGVIGGVTTGTPGGVLVGAGIGAVAGAAIAATTP